MCSRTSWPFGALIRVGVARSCLRKALAPALFMILATAMGASGGAAQSSPPVAPSGGPDSTYAAGPSQETACAPDAITLCLNGGRFKVQVHWVTPLDFSGMGLAVLLSGDTGYFWFFDETNTEVVLKILDGCAFNQSFWVFAAGLTDLNVLITTTDTRTGSVAAYRNRQGTPFAPIQDISAFHTCDAPGQAAAKSQPLVVRPQPLPPPAAWNDFLGSLRKKGSLSISQPVCLPSSTRLCLNSARFSVEATWATPDGRTGQGQAVPLSTNSGYFWFFDPTNVEMVIKVLRGCGLNQRFWVYAAGLTNVEVTYTVTDVITGASHAYHNPANHAFTPVQDTSALAACLPSCNSKELTVADIQSAAGQSIQGADDPFGADFNLVLNRFMALESCDLAGDSAPAPPPPAGSVRDCDGSFCGDVQYCGPGNSQKNWSLGILSVKDTLNRACFQHDTCYTGQCYPGDCYFLPNLTGSCDQPLLAACDSILQNHQAACANADDCLVCAIAKGLYNVAQNPRPAPNDCQAPPCSDPLGLVCNHSAGRCVDGCVTAISPIRQSVGPAGGSGSVAVTAPLGCDWTPAGNADWIAVTSGAGGDGNGSFSYSVIANDTINQRSGSIDIAGQTLVLTQDGAPCSYTIDSTGQAFGTSGGSGSVAVTALAGCGWTATSLADWITVTSGSSGSGEGSVQYTVTTTDTSNQRSGALLIAGQFFTITQDGASCSYSISPAGQAFGAGGGNGSVAVTALGGCGWTATSSDDWITVGTGGGSGDGTVSFSVDANGGGSPRTGSITIAGQILTVTQDGAPCIYSISPSGAFFGADGGGDSVSVTAPTDCEWTATSDSGWLTITSGGSGSGDGTVTYFVSSNPDPETETGSLTIAGMSFIVTQAGQPESAARK